MIEGTISVPPPPCARSVAGARASAASDIRAAPRCQQSAPRWAQQKGVYSPTPRPPPGGRPIELPPLHTISTLTPEYDPVNRLSIHGALRLSTTHASPPPPRRDGGARQVRARRVVGRLWPGDRPSPPMHPDHSSSEPMTAAPSLRTHCPLAQGNGASTVRLGARSSIQVSVGKQAPPSPATDW